MKAIQPALRLNGLLGRAPSTTLLKTQWFSVALNAPCDLSAARAARLPTEMKCSIELSHRFAKAVLAG